MWSSSYSCTWCTPFSKGTFLLVSPLRGNIPLVGVHFSAFLAPVTVLLHGAKSWQLALYQVYDNFCLPHASLRQPRPQQVLTNGTGSAKQWRPCTPAMAAGLTDRVWTLREVLLFRVPPWPHPARGGGNCGGVKRDGEAVW